MMTIADASATTAAIESASGATLTCRKPNKR
jgi:hypothetical protein